LFEQALRQQCEYFKFAIADTERFAHARVWVRTAPQPNAGTVARRPRPPTP
jgi:hypothetical protein